MNARTPLFLSRRHLVGGLVATALPLPVRAQARKPARSQLEYPSTDLAYFDKPITPSPFPIAFGCAAISWHQGPRPAVEEISEAGFLGIQLMPNAMKEWSDPLVLKAELAKRHLTLVTFSGGNPSDVTDVDKEVEALMVKANYARQAGAYYFQITSPNREHGTSPTRLKALAKIVDEVGKRTSALGMRVGFHNHIDQLVETTAELDALLAATNPKNVGLLLDVGHCRAAGGDPAAVIRKHSKRLVMLHLKDVQMPANNERGANFVPLGQGAVDFPAVFAALERIKYRGWAIIELDSPPQGISPLSATQESKRFVEQTLQVKI